MPATAWSIIIVSLRARYVAVVAAIINAYKAYADNICTTAGGPMQRTVVFGLAMLAASCSAAFAQSGGPTYQGDPDTYKVIFENETFRVIEATWKPGATDKPHTHPLPSVVYFLTDCTQKVRDADGTVHNASSKAGMVRPVPIIAKPHTAENVGASDCRAIFVEKK